MLLLLIFFLNYCEISYVLGVIWGSGQVAVPKTPFFTCFLRPDRFQIFFVIGNHECINYETVDETVNVFETKLS